MAKLLVAGILTLVCALATDRTQGSTWLMLCAGAPEGSAAPQPKGVFYRFTTTVAVGEGPVFLSSTPDGRGPVRTDDQALLLVTRSDGSARMWSHDFRDQRSGAVIPQPAQNLQEWFGTGANTVTLVLSDVLPPVYSTSPYYLVFQPPSAPVAPTMPPDTSPAAKNADAGMAPQEPAGLLVQPPPPVAAESADLDKGVAGFPGIQDVSGGVGTGAAGVGYAWALAACALFIALVWAMRFSRRRETGPSLMGLVNLYDQRTGQRLNNVDLSRLGKQAVIGVHPLQITSAQAVSGGHNEIARLVREGSHVLCLGDQTGGVPSPMILHDKDEIKIVGRVILEYRNPIEPPAGNSADKSKAGQQRWG